MSAHAILCTYIRSLGLLAFIIFATAADFAMTKRNLDTLDGFMTDVSHEYNGTHRKAELVRYVHCGKFRSLSAKAYTGLQNLVGGESLQEKIASRDKFEGNACLARIRFLHYCFGVEKRNANQPDNSNTDSTSLLETPQRPT